MLSRRAFLADWLAGLPAFALGRRLPGLLSLAYADDGAGARGMLDAIDRRARVARHDPIVRRFDPLAPLSVGNGGFAFTADATGLQTFPEHYGEIPLATEAEWGWHAFPNPASYRLDDALVAYDAHGRSVSYASAQASAASQWLRANPHRLSLARIGFVLRGPGAGAGTPVGPGDLTDVWQRLDLWTGTLESRFRLGDRPVRVLTCAHPTRDLVAVRVELPARDTGMLALRIAFPYASAVHTGDPADWSHPERHTTELVRSDRVGAAWRRELDQTRYGVRAAWSDAATLARESEHVFRLEPQPGSAAVELVIEFDREGGSPEALPSAEAVGRAAADHWQRFWSEGGAVDLSAATDPRARELERRIVLSEYLTAIQCAGTLPPQETGETFNSWHGKFHLEMHWWHAAHFALWDRVGLLERSLPWYGRILPAARATARRQGTAVRAGPRWWVRTGARVRPRSGLSSSGSSRTRSTWPSWSTAHAPGATCSTGMGSWSSRAPSSWPPTPHAILAATGSCSGRPSSRRRRSIRPSAPSTPRSSWLTGAGRWSGHSGGASASAWRARPPGSTCAAASRACGATTPRSGAPTGSSPPHAWTGRRCAARCAACSPTGSGPRPGGGTTRWWP